MKADGGWTKEDRSRCENCYAPTERQCNRCGQRICRKCATDHPARDYESPQELWPKCERKPRAALAKARGESATGGME